MKVAAIFDTGSSLRESFTFRLFGSFLLYSWIALNVSSYVSTVGLEDGASDKEEISISSFYGSVTSCLSPFFDGFLEKDLWSSENLSFYSNAKVFSASLSSVEELSSHGLSFGLKFLDFQLDLTNPLAFSKFVAKF